MSIVLTYLCRSRGHEALAYGLPAEASAKAGLWTLDSGLETVNVTPFLPNEPKIPASLLAFLKKTNPNEPKSRPSKAQKSVRLCEICGFFLFPPDWRLWTVDCLPRRSKAKTGGLSLQSDLIQLNPT